MNWVLGVGFLAGLLAIVWWQRPASRPVWRPLTGYFPGSQCSGDVDEKRLVAALQAAEGFLIARTSYTAANLALVGHFVRVRVQGSELWEDLWGRHTSAMQSERAMIVGPSLSGLAHELAHLAEQVIEGTSKPGHETWAEDGVFAALDDYDKWLSPLPKDSLRTTAACRYWRPL